MTAFGAQAAVISAARTARATPAVGLGPDPLLSANVYCAGRLCHVVQHLVAPFWNEWRRVAAAGDLSGTTAGYLWIVRYARCGEHLKLRLHCAAAAAPALRRRLDAAQAAYFARLALEPEPAPDGRHSTPTALPVDAEDRANTDYPDRSFLWTEYGRSHLSLGYRPYLDDDAYVALMTACLARSTELALSGLRCDSIGGSDFAVQRKVLLGGLLTALPALLPDAGERSLYLLYHRDCLLRYVRRRRGWRDGAGAMRQLAEVFARRAERQPAAMVRLADSVARWRWEAARPQPAASTFGEDAGTAWCAALRGLAAYAGDLAGQPAFCIDPFADLPVFPVYFKALHAFANQAGFDPANEAFLFDCLVRTAADPALRDRPVRLRPEL